MGFYDLDKKQRLQLVDKINKEVFNDIEINQQRNIIIFCSDNDTYIRKTAYLAIGKIFKNNHDFQNKIIILLEKSVLTFHPYQVLKYKFYLN